MAGQSLPFWDFRQTRTCLGRGLRAGLFVEFVQFGFQEFLVGQLRSVFSHDGRGDGAAERIFHDLAVFGRAEEHANGWTLVRFPHIAVERFEIEFEFADVLRLKLLDFQFDGYETSQAAMKEKQVEFEIPAADLDGIVAADEAKVAAEFDQKILEALDQAAMKVALGVVLGETEEFEQIAVFEDGCGVGV